MANTTRDLVVAVAAAGILLGADHEVQAAARPVVSVAFQNGANINPSVINRAMAAVTRTFAATGITLTRRHADEDAGTADHRITVVLMAKATADFKTPNPLVMGAAAEAEFQCGTIAYVFYDRIVSFAKAEEQDVTLVMALVIAHELGHLLLPPASHAADGVMKATWQRSDVDLVDQGRMRFSIEQAAAMRARLARVSRSANH